MWIYGFTEGSIRVLSLWVPNRLKIGLCMANNGYYHGIIGSRVSRCFVCIVSGCFFQEGSACSRRVYGPRI